MNRRTDARRGSSPIRTWLFGGVLVIATVFAYQSVWHAGFIWDDDVYVTENPLLTAPDGLRRIWFSLGSPSQYFPLSYTSFYFERYLWGLQAAGYHWVNILLHAANALLLWRLLSRLRLPGAWIGAAIFALHPVQVESVAWITERKNVLMGLFFLLTLRAWVEFMEEKSRGRWWFYAAALGLYALALAAKTTACTLPAALLLILWLKRIPINWRNVAQVAPFAVLGTGMGLVTMWWERYHQGTQGEVFAVGPAERLLIAGRALWFHLGKLLWPSNLTFSYPHWTISASDPVAYVGVAAAIALGVMIWRGEEIPRRSLGAAVFFYATTLSPVLGFIMLFTFRYTYVADHYQYLACIGPAALAGAGLAEVEARWPQARRFVIAGGAVLLLTLGALTWRQGRVYRSDELLWRDTLAKNPASWLACNNLGNDLLPAGKTDEALALFRRELELAPGLAESYCNLANALTQKGQMDDALAQYEKALTLEPGLPEAHFNLANAFRQIGRMPEAIEHYRKAVELKPGYAEAHSNFGYALFQLNKVPEAISQFQAAVALQPNNVGVLNNLAWVLANNPSDPSSDGAKAVALAQRANALDGNNPILLRTLAAAYATAGNYPAALQAAKIALPLAQAQGNNSLSSSLEAEIQRYQAGPPSHPALQ